MCKDLGKEVLGHLLYIPLWPVSLHYSNQSARVSMSMEFIFFCTFQVSLSFKFIPSLQPTLLYITESQPLENLFLKLPCQLPWLLLKFDQWGMGEKGRTCGKLEAKKGEGQAIPSHTGTPKLHVFQAARFCSKCLLTPCLFIIKSQRYILFLT